MGLNRATFATIPDGLILEICSFLDIEALVALSQTNKALYTLSRSFKSYWIPSILRSHLIPPLASHLPLASFSASELKNAAHKAIWREKNLSRPTPALFSYNHIEWPYEFPAGSLEAEDRPNPLDEEPDDVTSMHLVHPNGKWLFFVSPNNVMRILNLENGTLVWEEKFDHMLSTARAVFANDFRGDMEARIAMVVLKSDKEDGSDDDDNEDDDEEINEDDLQSVLQVFQLTLHPDKAVVTMNLLLEHPIEIRVVYLDIAGEYIALIEDRDTGTAYSYGAGPLHLFHWPSKQFVSLPPLLPCVTVSAFQDYLFGIGVDEYNGMIFQAIAFPHVSNPATSEPLSNLDASNEPNTDTLKRGILAASIEIPVSKNGTVTFQDTDVCHAYLGLTPNIVRVWSHEESYPGWNVFILEADFGKDPERWFEGYSRRTSRGEFDGWREIQHKLVWDTVETKYWVITAAPGRRFIWHRSEDVVDDDENRMQENEEEDTVFPQNRRKKLHIFTSVLDRIPFTSPAEEPDSNFEDEEYMKNWTEKMQSQTLTVPDGLVMDSRTAVYTISLEEWSGTAVVILTNGDIWVLRYGHS